MNAHLSPLRAALATVAAAAIAGCGSSATSPATGGGSAPAAGGATQPGALAADATSAATGDVPDNQQFLTFTSRAAGFSMRYPEGWARGGSGRTVTFRDKNNVVRVVVASGPAPTPASVAGGLTRLKAREPSLKAGPARRVTVGGKPAVEATYTTRSAPNAVTGKRVTLTVDRYVLARGGRVATVDLGTPVGVDNVDAYRLIIGSFRWR
jgi:hypothetical protein